MLEMDAGDGSKANGANTPSRLLVPSESLHVLRVFASTSPADTDVPDHAWQALPKDVPPNWEVRHNEALGKWRASKATTALGWTAYVGGMAMALTQLTARKEYCHEIFFYETHEVCTPYTKTNRPLAAGGWFTAAAGGIVLALGQNQRASAGAELAVLEAERLPVHHEPVTAPGTGMSNSDFWRNVSGLQPGQLMRVDVRKGQGRNTSGWFIKADDQKVTLYDGKEVLAIDKAAIRRVRAVALGRERSGPRGLAIGLAGIASSVGAAFLLRRQGPLFEETGPECVICTGGPMADKDLTWAQAAPLVGAMGVSTVASLVMASRGRPKTVYEADAKAGRGRSASSNGGTTERGDARSRTRSEKELALMVPSKGVGVTFVVRW
jgi:hypothetical protein